MVLAGKWVYGRTNDPATLSPNRPMNPVRLFFGLVTALGLAVTVGSGYLVVRGPFFGGGLLDPIPLFAALVAFVAGLVLMVWGATRLFGIGARI